MATPCGSVCDRLELRIGIEQRTPLWRRRSLRTLFTLGVLGVIIVALAYLLQVQSAAWYLQWPLHTSSRRIV